MNYDTSKADEYSTNEAAQHIDWLIRDELNHEEMDVVVGSGGVTGSRSKHAPGP